MKQRKLFFVPHFLFLQVDTPGTVLLIGLETVHSCIIYLFIYLISLFLSFYGFFKVAAVLVSLPFCLAGQNSVTEFYSFESTECFCVYYTHCVKTLT